MSSKKRLTGRALAVFMAIGMTLVFALQALAGTTLFGSNQSGNKVFTPRGYSVTAAQNGSEQELWLESPFDHAYYDGTNNKATVTLGSDDDALEVNSLEAGTYTFHAWFDKNPAGGELSGDDENYLAVYIGENASPVKLKDLSGSPYNVSFQDPVTSVKDPNGETGQWSIEFTMTLQEGETYRFVFQRGLQARNGVTLVLQEGQSGSQKGYIGYINGDSVTAEEKAAYDLAKDDVYEFVLEKTSLGKDEAEKEVYALTFVPMEHSVEVPSSEEPTPVEPVTEPTTQSTTKSTTQSTTQSTTKSTTQSTTQSTTKSTTQSTTQSTTKSTTQSTTQSTTKSTTQSTTQSTTKSTTQSTTHSTTKPTTQPTTKRDESTTKKAESAPVAKLNGLVKGPDDKWALYKDDQVEKTFIGLAKNKNGWYYLKDGYVDWNYTGFAKNEKGWWRVENGKVNFEANSIYKQPSNGVWYKTTNGFVTWDETGVFKNVNGWWRVENSRVNFYADGIYKNDNGWWKTTGGKVHFNENGIFKNENGQWYVKGSKVDFSKNGKVTFKGKTYNVTNGRARLA